MLAGPFGTRYVGDMDRMFDAYSAAVNAVTNHVRDTIARDPDDSEFVYRQATRAKALDATRGMLPGGEPVERRHLRHRPGVRGACCCACAPTRSPRRVHYADLMLLELRKVIPSFLRRVDLPDRGGRWSEYLADTREATADLVDQLFGGTPVDPVPEVQLVDFDPDAEDKLLAAICYPHSDLSELSLLERVRKLGADERVALVRAYVGDRSNRRHKPGRAFERIDYRFDVLSDYGAFRDLQRHRMLTIEWQRLTPNHGYTRARPDRRRRRRRLVRRDDGSLGAPVRRPRRRSSRSRRRTRWRWRTGCAT